MACVSGPCTERSAVPDRSDVRSCRMSSLDWTRPVRRTVYDAAGSAIARTQPGWVHAGRGDDRRPVPCASQTLSMSWLAAASRIRVRALSEYRGCF